MTITFFLRMLAFYAGIYRLYFLLVVLGRVATVSMSAFIFIVGIVFVIVLLLLMLVFKFFL